MTLQRLALSLSMAWLVSLPLVADDTPIPIDSMGALGVFAAFDKERISLEYCSTVLPDLKAEFDSTTAVLERRINKLGGAVLRTKEFRDMTTQPVHESVVATIEYERAESRNWMPFLVKAESCRAGHKYLKSATNRALKASVVRGLRHFRDVAKRADTYVPVCFTEPVLNIKVCSESDGRHLQATDSDGRTLWRTNPFVDAELSAYRRGYPRIDWIGAGESHCPSLEQAPACVGISYDSSQFGVVSIRDGSFEFMGQD